MSGGDSGTTAEAFWDNAFGSSTAAVDLLLFCAKVKGYFDRIGRPAINTRGRQSLQSVVQLILCRSPTLIIQQRDGTCGKSVSRAEFVLFESRFGPFPATFDRAYHCFFDNDGCLLPWFHGNAVIPKVKMPGQFYVRFAEEQPETLAIVFAYMDGGDLKLRKSKIFNHGLLGFGFNSPTATSSAADCSPSIQALVQENAACLIRPLESALYQLHQQQFIQPYSSPGTVKTEILASNRKPEPFKPYTAMHLISKKEYTEMSTPVMLTPSGSGGVYGADGEEKSDPPSATEGKCGGCESTEADIIPEKQAAALKLFEEAKGIKSHIKALPKYKEVVALALDARDVELAARARANRGILLMARVGDNKSAEKEFLSARNVFMSYKRKIEYLHPVSLKLHECLVSQNKLSEAEDHCERVLKHYTTERPGEDLTSQIADIQSKLAELQSKTK